MRSRVVRLLALLALLGAVSPALGDAPADAVGAVDALVLGDDPLDPYDDPPAAANAFAGPRAWTTKKTPTWARMKSRTRRRAR